jgi:hypothetical protein
LATSELPHGTDHPASRGGGQIEAAYQTDPEIRLGCIIVSDTLDTPRLTQVLQAVPGVERVEEA